MHTTSRLRSLLMLVTVTLVLGAAALGGAPPAGAAEAGSSTAIAVRVGTDGVPIVTLTNAGATPCQVLTTTLGTVQLARVEQDGAAVEPVAFDAAFAEALDLSLGRQWKTLAPGETADLTVPTVPVGPTGKALETVSWSAGAGTAGLLHPIRGDQSVGVAAAYAAPVVPDGGAPACGDAHTLAAAAGDPSAPIAAAPVAAGSTGSVPLGLIIGGMLAVLLLVVVVLIVVVRRGRRGPATAALLLLAVGLVRLVGTAPEASATIVVDPGMASAWGACEPMLRGPGGDPAGILPALDAPGVTVHIVDAGSDQTHEGAISPTDIFIQWNTGDHHAYAGSGGNADPCDSLYHEMYHGSEDAAGGQDTSECVTADGPSGVRTNEVNATRAQNMLREALGRPARSHYGDTPLPAGPCLPPDQQPKNPACTGTGCGSSNGDPHLLTFDGSHYDFQAVGEFVAARDTAGGFTVQVRQQAYPDSDVVAVNTAVALDVGGDHVQVDLEGAAMKLRLDGASVPYAAGPLPKGGTLTTSKGSRGAPERRGADREVLTVNWPDGSNVILTPIGHYGLHVLAQPAAARAGRLEGLLGNFDGEPGNDIRPHGGDPIAEPTHEHLYPGYADGWRVNATESLFTYDQGKTTDTFTDRSFPKKAVDLATLPGRAAAEARCRKMGVTDPDVLAGCILDVALTGQVDFAAAAAAEQRFNGVLRVDGPAIAVAVSQPGSVVRLSFAAQAGQKLYLEVTASNLPGQCGVVSLRAFDDRSLNNGCVINGSGRIDTTTIPETGTYSIVVDPDGPATGDLRLRLRSVRDANGTIEPDGPEVAVRIADPGGVGTVSFDGHSGQRVFVKATTTGLPSQCGLLVLRDPAGASLTSGCVINGEGEIDASLLPSDGRYSIVVDPSDESVGETRLQLIVTADQRVSTSIGGSTVTVELTKPGSQGLVTFEGRSGQRVTIEVPTSDLPSQCGVVDVRSPDGTTVTSGCIINGAGGVDAFELPASGQYTIVVDPQGAITGRAEVKVR